MSRRVSIVRIPCFGPRDLTLALRSPYEREGRDKERKGGKGTWRCRILTILSRSLNNPWTELWYHMLQDG
jgi:hypothetical protein